MTYRQDPIYQTVRWLGTRKGSPQAQTFADSFAKIWSEWARVQAQDVGVRLGLVNYKPFERARVMADVTFVPGRLGSSPTTLNLFLSIYADPETARGELKLCSGDDLLGCYGPPVDRNIVAWTLPNAPNLRELHDLLNPASFQAFLSRSPDLSIHRSSVPAPTLIRYVPLKRAILTWDCPGDGARYYLKLIDGPASAAAALNLRELHARALHGELNFAVPKPVHYSPDLHTMIMGAVPGRSFTAVMSECRPEPFADVGRALASLHRLPAVPMTVWSADKELADLRRHLEGVKRALPKLGKRLDAIVARLGSFPSLSELSYVPIHGNLFGDQILYDAASPRRRVGIVDWDAWSFGDPHFDLGRLIAHFLYVARLERLPEAGVTACVEALLRGYGKARGSTINREALRWHVATALLLRAKISSLRKLRPGWPRHVELMTAEAERILNDDALAPRKNFWTAKTPIPTELVA